MGGAPPCGFGPTIAPSSVTLAYYLLPGGDLAPPDALVGVLPIIFALVPGVVLIPSANCHCARFSAFAVLAVFGYLGVRIS